MLYCLTFSALILLSCMMCCMMFLVANIRKREKTHDESKKNDEIEDKDWNCGIIVPFSGNEIMNILTDFHRYAQYVPDIIESTVYERNAQTCKVRFLTKVLFLRITSHIEHTIKDNGITWRLDPGFKDILFEKNTGSWIVTPISESESRIAYNVVMKGNLPFPPTILDAIKKEAFRRATVWVIDELKNKSKTNKRQEYKRQEYKPWYRYIPCISCLFIKCIK